MSRSWRCELARRPRAAAQTGLSLIELMVALVIGMVLSLAIVSVLKTSQDQQRTSASLNDLAQSGNFAMYVIDKWVRSAGTGLVQTASDGFGCDIHAMTAKGVAILPRGSSALPLPFKPIDTLKPTGTKGLFRLAPLIIVPGGSTASSSGQPSDALILMSGAAGYGEMPVPASDRVAPTASSMALQNALPFRANDLVLITDQLIAADQMGPCLVQQVDPAFVNPPVGGGAPPTTLPLAGQFYRATIDGISVANTSTNARVTALGNVVQQSLRNPPSFLLIGVGAGNVLFSYDLLQQSDAEDHSKAMPAADSVFEMHALYGVLQKDGTLGWKSPDATGYQPKDLLAGSPAARDTLLTIRAVRIGLIMVSPLIERDTVTANSTITLFADLGATMAFSRATLTADQQRQRFRTVEATIPLRNF